MKIEDEDLQALRSQKDFNYGGNINVRQKGFGYRFFRFLGNILREIGNLLKAMPVLFKLVLWGFALFFLVVLITKTRVNRLFFSDKTINQPDYQVKDAEEVITNFETAIRTEIMQKQYRKAIRLLYLWTLHSLDQLKIIRYSKEKTNIDYLHELGSTGLKKEFSGLTGIYNHVWYGHFDINKEQYQQYEQHFMEFQNKLNV